MEAAAFSLSMVDHGLDDSAIASISFMVARSTSPTPVKLMSLKSYAATSKNTVIRC